MANSDMVDAESGATFVLENKDNGKPSASSVQELESLKLEASLEAAQAEAEQEWEQLEQELEKEAVTASQEAQQASAPSLVRAAAADVAQDLSLSKEERDRRVSQLLTASSGLEVGEGQGEGQRQGQSQRGGENGSKAGGVVPASSEGGVGKGGGGQGGAQGGGARALQLEELLRKATQYSGFILSSQEEVAASQPIAVPISTPPTLASGKEEVDIEEAGETDETSTSPMEGGEASGKSRSCAGSKGGKRNRKRGASSGSRKGREGGNKRAKGEDGQALNIDSAATKMAQAKKDSEADTTFRQPSNLVGGTLKGYQLEGLRWLVTLYENGLSGILADEMGLGKTIQVISLIAHLRMKKVNGPFLITAPLATLPNWINEFKKWLPDVSAVLYHGSKDARAKLRSTVMRPRLARTPSFPVVVTSYEVCIADRNALQAYRWQYLIIDEGQRIKNMNCRLVRELKQLMTENRILLSGTPIQNTLEELWSLLNFVNPLIFDDLTIFCDLIPLSNEALHDLIPSNQIFQSWFGFRNIGKETSVDDIVVGEEHSKIVSKLHDILRPFLIRRLKRDVLSKEGLPPKKEVVVYAGMTSLQRDYYALCDRGELRGELMRIGIEGAKEVSQINQNMNKRKICQHPFLFGEPKDKATGEFIGVVNPEILLATSGKLALMDRMLRKLKAGGHKVLIFSQMTSMLDVHEDYIRHRGWGYCRIDGSVNLLARQSSIDEFNEPSSSKFIFLLSTRAGGLGINLTAADTVIIHDSDWNPHQDSQAQDRCHRFGQKKPVVVYRLLTAGSVEIDMMEKQISKNKLARMAVHGGDFRKAGRRSRGTLTTAGLRQLLVDDVENLAKRGTCLEAGEGVDQAIPEEELDSILDRNRLFVGTEWNGSLYENKPADGEAGAGEGSPKEEKSVALLPREGTMYDIVDDRSTQMLDTVT